MRQLQIQKKTQDKIFSVKLQSNNSTFNPSLQKTNDSVQIKSNFNSNLINTLVNASSNKVETKADVNNQPTDIYYDEVIFYDGGGVEGYGYQE